MKNGSARKSDLENKYVFWDIDGTSHKIFFTCNIIYFLPLFIFSEFFLKHFYLNHTKLEFY